MAEVLGARRDLFDVPDDVAYFNAASLSPMLHAVREAGETALRRRARPWTIREPDWFTDVERLRSLLGALLGTDAEGVALVPATSYGFAVAASILAAEGPRGVAAAGVGVPRRVGRHRRPVAGVPVHARAAGADHEQRRDQSRRPAGLGARRGHTLFVN
ncbi:hypothetical protein AB0H83_09110 [Dactylosporangium sp. NPDC050688]|uniref:hypothetical protein n=1 Tax=Dactylosporangium sp. NPDC050688 TaxID=3157217 RepID=UPI0033D6F971